jgi:hypothetical protein
VAELNRRTLLGAAAAVPMAGLLDLTGRGTSADAATAGTVFGFNVTSGWSAYLPGGVFETAQQVNRRLVGDYGPFGAAKIFPNDVPSTYADCEWPQYPSVWTMTLALTSWRAGFWAGRDAAVVRFARSLPAGKVAYLCHNEIDLLIDPTGPAWGRYVADVNHLHDLLESEGLTNRVHSAVLFTTFNQARVRTVPRLLANARLHDLIFDADFHQYPGDGDGSKRWDAIDAAVGAVGVPWHLAETGDLRPGVSSGAAPSDATRATVLTRRIDRMLRMTAKPTSCCWFDRNSFRDYRILTPPHGNDRLTQAAYRAFVAA